MRVFSILVVILAVLGVASPALAGSTSAVGSGPTSAGGSGPALVAGSGPALVAGSGPASRLVLERTGGFAGVHDTFVVDRSVAGGARVLRLAGTARFRRLGRSYQPANPCCDRFSYRLTATYPIHHGAAKTITTVQGAAAPKILWDVITSTEQLGQRS